MEKPVYSNVDLRLNMIEYDKLRLNEATRLAKETSDVDVIIALSKHLNSMVRKKSLVEMCPCRVRNDIDKFWERVFEMIADEDPIVRAQVRSLVLVTRLKCLIYHVFRILLS